MKAFWNWWDRVSPEGAALLLLGGPLAVTAVLALAFLALAGCGKKEEAKKPDVDMSALSAMFDDYKLWNAWQLESQEGWTGDDCDATLKTGLLGTVTNVDLTLAQQAPGEWWRRRVSKGNCYPAESASSSSRDMATGEAAWISAHGRVDLAQQLVSYVDNHTGNLGVGDPFRIGVRPPLYATLLKLAHRVVPIESDIPVTVGGESSGDARHIAAWHLLVRADVSGGMPEGYNDWIKARASEQPQSPLFQYMLAAYVTGQWQPFVDAAMNARYFPRSHLPTSDEVCDDFVMQRDMGADWQPCPDTAAHKRQWSGSDWLAVVARALKSR